MPFDDLTILPLPDSDLDLAHHAKDNQNSHIAPRPHESNHALRATVERACARIAPTWPLDRFIAVNPYWGHVGRPIAETAAQLAVLSGTSMLVSPDVIRGEWERGAVVSGHLQAAADAARSGRTVVALLADLEAQSVQPAPVAPGKSSQFFESVRTYKPAGSVALAQRMPLVTDLVDVKQDLRHSLPWREFVTQQISQVCASYFDQGQSAWQPERKGGLYATWLRESEADHSPGLLMGFQGFAQHVKALPRDPIDLIAGAMRAMQMPESSYEGYFTALLLSINGWASWCAYQRWEARLANSEDEQIIQLLAIRLAWEWLLHRNQKPAEPPVRLSSAWHSLDTRIAEARRMQSAGWLWQDALERAYQDPICQALSVAPAPKPKNAVVPRMQAVFCIDVRSEVYRRALESTSPNIQTLGCAGFFAMFVSYLPLGGATSRPQLPGLMAAQMCVTDQCDTPELGGVLARQRRTRLQGGAQWQAFKNSAGSGFSFVESCGLTYAWQLLTKSLCSAWGRAAEPVNRSEEAGIHTSMVRPRLPASGAPELEDRVVMAATALRVMGITHDFARLVLIAGHGSTSANNPHAAGLDCGACGGQTGEVNARALAALLNDARVRQGLKAKGIQIPPTTYFLPGLHNTTTDDLQLFDTDLMPPSHDDDRVQLRMWLDTASTRARAERAPGLGIDASHGDDAAIRKSIYSRTHDWAQTRPEWGLANCAAFIVAPRSRTRHLNLEGRSFLNDYVWKDDEEFSLLEIIFTGPMVVTNWINAQYNASTIDPVRYGSGDKVLHNVVGGNLGVFEGNGGDLRIGLPWQSVHDGQSFRHTPLRLSVFVQAPQSAIDNLIAKHDNVRHLVDNQWLHLFRIEDDAGVWRYAPGGGWDSTN